MIARWLMVASVGMCLVIGSTGCRPKNQPAGTTAAASKPKRTWFGLGPPKKEPAAAYSATTAQEPKPKRTWFGLGPPKKQPTTAQANMNNGSRFKSQAQTEPRTQTATAPPPAPAPTAAAAPTAGSAAPTAGATYSVTATPAPKPAEKRGWFGWGSKNTGPAYVAQDERVETDMAEPVEIDVLANEGAPRSNLDLDKIIIAPNNGTARIVEHKNGKGPEMQMIVYTPNRAFSGDDTIRYRVERGNEKSEATATVHVNRRGVLRISGTIDHKETILIRGNQIWFRHRYGVVPQDVKVNGHAADLGYDKDATAQGTDSKKITFAPGMPTDHAPKVEANGGPDAEGQLMIVEEPKAENNYTTTLMLYDPREGARHWDVVVKFDAE